MLCTLAFFVKAQQLPLDLDVNIYKPLSSPRNVIFAQDLNSVRMVNMAIDACGETYPPWSLRQSESNITPIEDGIESSLIGHLLFWQNVV